MNRATLDILRCPYCGWTLDLVTSSFHRTSGDEIQDGILGCQCCVFPVVDGIPVMHLQPAATAARELIEQGRPDRARRAMFGLDDEGEAERFDELAASEHRRPTAASSKRLGEHIEGGYFLYRFADPTYIVGHAVVRAVAGTVLRGGGRAIDICGGSGHLTRALMDLSSPAPVLADLYFAKIWLARRFTAPGCEAGLLRRQLADAVRARGVQVRDVLGRVHVHLDEASVRPATCCASSIRAITATARRPERRAHQPHAQPVHVDSVARPAADARRLPAPVRNDRGRASSASPGCSRTWSPADRSISRVWTMNATLEADPALTIDRQPAARRVRAASARAAAVRGARRIPAESALRRDRIARRATR